MECPIIPSYHCDKAGLSCELATVYFEYFKKNKETCTLAAVLENLMKLEDRVNKLHKEVIELQKLR